MKQLNLPRAILITRIVFLFIVVGGVVFVAARGNFTSRASNKPAITTGPGESEGKSRSSHSYASDLKAFTLSPPCTTNPTVVNNSDSGAGSLRQAIADACDASTITFNMAIVTSPITLTTAELVINKNLAIMGPGAGVLMVRRSTSGGTPDFRIFKINSGNTVSISGLTISNGQTPASTGGGIWNELSVLNLNNCTVSGNSAVHGGGVFNNIGTLNVTNSTFLGNSAVNNGGGIDSDSNSTLNIVNSTFSGNSANGGGAVMNESIATVTNSTLTGNTAIGSGGGVANQPNAQVSIRNSILALNTTVTICGGNCPNGSPDLFGDFTSQGHNLIGKSDGSTGFTNGINGDQVGSVATPLNPRLGPLANNAGPTQTHALLADSTAIDAGNNCVLTDSCSPSLGLSLTTDQRGAGFPRATDGDGDGTATVDIGAFEVQTILVTNTADSGAGSLRQAITDANIAADTNAINFQSGLTGTITLLTELPFLATSMKLKGPGANLMTVARSTGASDFHIFTIYSGPSNVDVAVTISGLTMTGSSAGGIQNLGTLTINNSAITSNTSTGGGGGITNGGGGAFGGLILNNTTVSNNSAVQSGGGINSLRPLTIINSTISGNRTDLHGGGIATQATTLTVINSTITNNRSDFNNDSVGAGGGITTFQNTTILRNTIIAGNFHGSGLLRTDVDGTLDSTSSFNLIGDGTGMSGITNSSNGNQVGTSVTPIDPRLGLLTNNGGPTLTHALLSGSPAIDAGNSSVVTNPPFTGPPFTDQRGGSFNRIADGDGNTTAIVDIGAYELQGILTVDKVTPPAGRVSGGQQIVLAGGFANLSTVTMGGAAASWSYTNGAGDTSMITVTTPAHTVGAVQIDLTPTSGSPYSKANAFAYLPMVFTDDTIMVGVTTVKAQHITELRQAVDAMRAVAGLSPAPWTDGTLTPNSSIIRAIHIQELRTYLDDAATRLGYSTSPYTDPSLTIGDVIKRIHIEALRQRVRAIAG